MSRIRALLALLVVAFALSAAACADATGPHQANRQGQACDVSSSNTCRQ